MILYSNFLPPKGFIAITLYPVIIFRKDKKDRITEITRNHEEIHLRQQKEWLIIFFYLIYLVEWIINIFKYKFNTHKAYWNISFEKEAYANQNDLDYLTTRKWYSNLKYR